MFLIYLILSLAGLSIGFVASILGVGGGILIVPVLFTILGFTHEVATSMSLCVIFFNALSSSITYIKQKRINYEFAVLLSIGVIPGAFLGGYMNSRFDSNTFAIALSVFLVFVLAMLIKFKINLKTKENVVISKRWKRGLPLMGLFVGVVSSFFGIGGGIINVPIFLLIFKLDVYSASATSMFIILITTSAGITAHLQYHSIPICETMIFSLFAIVGTQIGSNISKKIPEKYIIFGLICIILIAITSLSFKVFI